MDIPPSSPINVYAPVQAEQVPFGILKEQRPRYKCINVYQPLPEPQTPFPNFRLPPQPATNVYQPPSSSSTVTITVTVTAAFTQEDANRLGPKWTVRAQKSWMRTWLCLYNIRTLLHAKCQVPTGRKILTTLADMDKTYTEFTGKKQDQTTRDKSLRAAVLMRLLLLCDGDDDWKLLINNGLKPSHFIELNSAFEK